MARLSLLLLLLPLAAASNDHMIVDGGSVSSSDFPWMGSWKSAYGSHMCGCVYVGGRYVITAGHCAQTSGNVIELGTNFLFSGSKYTTSRVTRHPRYGDGEGFVANDITVAMTSEAIETGLRIKPASLPANADNPGGVGWITGWGKTCGNCGVTLILQGTQIAIISDRQCKEIWEDSVSPSSHICVYDNKGSACSGDSGGPLSQGETVYGLASWVAAECSPDTPSVYARVGAYRSWICRETDNQARGC